MHKPTIISGEASETDSEDEVQNTPISIKGAVIKGEDTESECENDDSICSASSALNNNSALKDEKCDSLLLIKLRECNDKLVEDLENYCQNTTEDATKNLVNIEQQLIKSQLTLQNSVTSLKSLTANSRNIKNKLLSLLSASFISNIKSTE